MHHITIHTTSQPMIHMPVRDFWFVKLGLLGATDQRMGQHGHFVLGSFGLISVFAGTSFNSWSGSSTIFLRFKF